MTTDTATANLGLIDQGTGNNNNTWGDIADANFAFLEDAITEKEDIATAGGTTVLTTAQGRSIFLHVTGTLAANATIEVPDRKHLFVVKNGTTGNFTLTVKPVLGTGVTVVQGSGGVIHTDGAGTAVAAFNLAAADIPFPPTGLISSTDVAAALAELDTELRLAGNIAFTPTGAIAATNVQAAITELDTEKAPLNGDTNQPFAVQSLSWEGGVHQINNNDGGGNVNFRLGHEYATGDKLTHAGGAVHMVGNIDAVNASFSIKLGAEGLSGAAVVWGPALTMTYDGVFTWSGQTVWHAGNPATQAEAEAGTSLTVGMPPLRVAQAIAALTIPASSWTSPAPLASGTATVPAGKTKALITVAGGAGGSTQSTYAGAAGSASSVTVGGVTATAPGGGAGTSVTSSPDGLPGVPTTGDINIPGGGASPRRFSGDQQTINVGTGGKGGLLIKEFTVTGGSTFSVTVGAGGIGGNSNLNFSGHDGYVYVEYL